ncbi:hypothetical protein [Streptomyces sp. NPDC008092]|uniref:hypothetical protein n=1 Tax=Streptomyces sp. NPDC008092 TaxID=3364808 RepID=UPI0036E3D7D7
MSSDHVISAQALEDSSITAAAVQRNDITIMASHGRPLITIRPDGTLELGDDYQPDEAARAFWDAVRRLAPDPMTREFGAPLKDRINAELAAGQRAQKQVERLDQMASAWKERLPEAINRDTAVGAVHQITRPDGNLTPGDPRQSAYDAVFAYIRQQPVDFLPTTVVERNAILWHAVHAALDAVGIPRKDDGQ